VEIVLNRRGGVPVRDQLVAQLELKILAGELRLGQRLPSVRSLARRLKVHHNTVSAAYQALQDSGHVELRRGSGVFVRRSGAHALEDAFGLDDMIRIALHSAFTKGFKGRDIRAAVERWLAAVPPDRIVVVDPAREMGELLVHEVEACVRVPASACTPGDVARDPGILSGLMLPYHGDGAAAGAGVRSRRPRGGGGGRRAVEGLPAGGIVLIVSRSPTVLPFASVFMRSLRGDEILIEPRLLAATAEWKRLVKAADVNKPRLLAPGVPPLMPAFHGRLDPDIAMFGFALDDDTARGYRPPAGAQVKARRTRSAIAATGAP
jgi:DNA-binding transcriptional regulator YhcF (GntR family)